MLLYSFKLSKTHFTRKNVVVASNALLQCMQKGSFSPSCNDCALFVDVVLHHAIVCLCTINEYSIHTIVYVKVLL